MKYSPFWLTSKYLEGTFIFWKTFPAMHRSPCVLSLPSPLPPAVGSGNYSAGNLPPPHPLNRRQNGRKASAERKIHFSPSLRTCAESQSGTSALRQVHGSVVSCSCALFGRGGKVNPLQGGWPPPEPVGGRSLICSLIRFNRLVRPFAPYQRFI